MNRRHIPGRRHDSPGRREKNITASRRFEEGLPITNKKQILGFFLVLLGLLAILSIVSYSDADQSRYESLKVWNIFSKQNQSADYDTSNWLGVAGILISNFFINDAFGYFSVALALIMLLFGFRLLRKKGLYSLFQPSVYLIMLMILLSTLFGLLRNSLGKEKVSYSLIGTSGEYFSSVLHLMVGTIGGYIIVFGLFLLFVFLLFDRDIVRSIARLRSLLERSREKFRKAKEEIEEKREEKLRQKRFTEFEQHTKIARTGEQRTGTAAEQQFIKDTKINRPAENEIVRQGTAKHIEQVSKGVLLDQDELREEKAAGKETDEVSRVHKKSVEKLSETEEPVSIEETLDEFILPGLDLLDEPLKEELELISDEELKENGRLLQAKLLHFDVKIEKVIATPGPVVTLYELIPAEDVKLSRIESLEDDIALAMKAKGIRMIIPIPGKGTVGVEIPNHKPSMVKIKGVIGAKKFNETHFQLPIAMGKTISGEVYVDDLARMPHLLIAGSTGSGKSVGINTIIASLIYKLHPSDLKFVLIDPKKIELNLYSKLKNHYLAVCKDISENIVTTPQNAVMVLKSLEIEMEKRYERLANATVRNVFDYNKKVKEGALQDSENIKHGKMPYLIVIIDELADLMITAAREVEDPIARLAQLARAVGIHLVLATQRPSVDVITGVIKANFSARIAYLVNSKVDSRTILDMNGAEQLIGQGDMLYLPPGVAKPLRMQSPFISVDEVDRITDFISGQKGFSKPFEMPSVYANKKKYQSDGYEKDELFEEAARLIVRYQQGSVSLLQRRLKVGYARAARIVDELESAGIVGPFDGSKAREVLVETEEELEQYL
jgi:S-DNA-T family DNA segregation ATPase FtsK/SpoIIIE